MGALRAGEHGGGEGAGTEGAGEADGPGVGICFAGWRGDRGNGWEEGFGGGGGVVLG